jgi:hypothetical protein
MKIKEQRGREFYEEYCEEFGKEPRIWDSEDIRNGMLCAWHDGFNFAKEKLLDICDAEHLTVTFTEIQRLGEKIVK